MVLAVSTAADLMPLPPPTHSPAVMETSTPLEWESVSTGVRHDEQVLLFIHLLNMGLGWGKREGRENTGLYENTHFSRGSHTTNTSFNTGLDTPSHLQTPNPVHPHEAFTGQTMCKCEKCVTYIHVCVGRDIVSSPI